MFASSFSSHSHITSARQPRSASAARLRASRARFPAILATQKSRFCFGTREPCLQSCPCQKQPCTKTARLRPIQARSGRPGMSLRCRRWLGAMARAMRRTASSGPVSRERMARMLAERSGDGAGSSVFLADLRSLPEPHLADDSTTRRDPKSLRSTQTIL